MSQYVTTFVWRDVRFISCMLKNFDQCTAIISHFCQKIPSIYSLDKTFGLQTIYNGICCIIIMIPFNRHIQSEASLNVLLYCCLYHDFHKVFQQCCDRIWYGLAIIIHPKSGSDMKISRNLNNTSLSLQLQKVWWLLFQAALLALYHSPPLTWVSKKCIEVISIIAVSHATSSHLSLLVRPSKLPKRFRFVLTEISAGLFLPFWENSDGTKLEEKWRYYFVIYPSLGTRTVFSLKNESSIPYIYTAHPR